MTIELIDQACRLLGSQEALAAALRIKSPSISEWRLRGRVPAVRCIPIESVTKGVITRYQLRPDIFGNAQSDQQAVSIAPDSDRHQDAAQPIAHNQQVA